MFALSALVSTCLLIHSQVWGQDQCTAMINDHFRCVDQGVESMPDHQTIKRRVDSCFSPCSGTPETFHQRQGRPPFPTPEQHQCVGRVRDRIRSSCQVRLGIPYSFPKMPNHPFLPPPHFGPPPPHFGPDPTFGAPGIENMITELCPSGDVERVRECIQLVRGEGPPPHLAFMTKMHQCLANLQNNPTCMQKLKEDQQEMCSCSQTEVRKDENMARLEICAALSPETLLARDIQSKRLPPQFFGPMCGRGGPSHFPPPSIPDFGPRQLEDSSESGLGNQAPEVGQEQGQVRYNPRRMAAFWARRKSQMQ